MIYRDYVQDRKVDSVSTPLGIFISVLTTLFTAEFSDILNIGGSGLYIKFSFILAAIISGFFTGKNALHWFKNKDKYTEKKFILDLKEKYKDNEVGMDSVQNS